MGSGVGKAGLALIGLWEATTAMANPVRTSVMPVACSATGAKLFTPAMSATDICRHFVRALGDAAHISMALPADDKPLAEGLVVELRFLPQGVASAKVARMHAGKAQLLPLYELAVSDRRLMPHDIETLAASVAQGMTTGRAGGG